MNITIDNAKFIVTNGIKQINSSGELIGYRLPKFYKFRDVFICKDAVSGYMVMDTQGTLSDGVIYKDYKCCETAKNILKLDLY